MGDELLQLLQDPEWVEGLIGSKVRLVHLRPKSGASHFAGLVDEQGRPCGWLRLLVGDARVKAGKAMRRAAEAGLAGEVERRELPAHQALALWGGLLSDPGLVRPLHRSRVGAIDPGDVLRHNPGRRLVFRRGDHVVRVSAQPHAARLKVIARELAARGVDVVEPDDTTTLGLVERPTISVWPLVDGHDLSYSCDEVERTAARRIVDALHSVSPSEFVSAVAQGFGEAPVRLGWAESRAAASAAAAQLVEAEPLLGRRAADLATMLPEEVGCSADVVLHGDLSLDQFLSGTRGVLLTDLDRAAVGPMEVDHASLAATELLAGRSPDMWQTTVPVSPAWVAAALLRRASGPWRGQGSNWRARTASLLDQAEAHLMGKPSSWQVPAVLDGRELITVGRAWPGTVRDGRPLVVVEGRDHDGRVRAGTCAPSGSATLLEYAADRRLASLHGSAEGGRVVVHRAGRRAVVARPDRYVKVLRGDRARAAARAATLGFEVARAVGLLAPEVLGHDETRIEMSVVPGVSLHELSGDPRWPAMWTRWAQHWRRLQALGPDEVAGILPVHDDEGEAAVLETWAKRVRAQRIGLDEVWLERLDEVALELRAAATRPVRHVVTHRDLHDKQLLASPQGLAVLDFDTLCWAAPELDLANLAVHARLREAQGVWTANEAELVVATAARLASSSGVAPEAWRLAERATLVRLTAVYAFRPQWRKLVTEWASRRWQELDVQSRRGVC